MINHLNRYRFDSFANYSDCSLCSHQVLEEVVEYLYDVYSEETVIIEDIKERFNKVKQPMEELPTSLEEQKRKLQKSLSSAKQLKDDTDDVLRWLSKMEKVIAQQSPISADRDHCARQQADHTYIQDEIDRSEPRFDKLTSQGEDAVDGMDDGGEKDALEEKMSDIKSRWSELKERSKDRKEILEDVVPQAKRYENATGVFLPWLSGVEKKAQDVEVILVEKEKIENQSEIVKQMSEELKEKKDVFNEIDESSATLLMNCDRDIAPLKESVDDVKKRWTLVNETVDNAARKIKDVREGIRSFENAVSPVEEVCAKVERQLEEMEPFGDDITKGDEQIDQLKFFLEDVKAEAGRFPEIEKAGEELIKIEDKPDNVTIVKQRTDHVAKRYEFLVSTLKDKIEKTEKAVESGKKLNDIEDEVVEKTKLLKKKTTKQETVAVDPKKVKEQLLEVEEWQTEAQVINTLCCEADLYGNEVALFNKLDPTVGDNIKERVAAVKAPLQEVIRELDEREKKLKDRLQECGAFHDHFDDFERRLKKIDERIQQQKEKPLSSNPGRITMTIAEIDNIGKDFMEELQLYRNVEKSGKQVLDTLDTEAEWKQLKGKLDDIAKLWDTIDKKIDAEKEHVVKVKALCTEFADKQADVTKWLDENEKKFQELEPESCELEKLAEQQKEINSVQSDIDHHKGQFGRLEVLIDELEDLCGEDVKETHETFDDVKEKWCRVEGLLLKRQDGITDMQEKMLKISDLTRPVKETISKVKSKVDDVTLMGADQPKVKKLADSMKKLQKQVDDLEPKVEAIEKLTNELQEGHPSSDCKPLRDELAAIKESFDNLFNDVGEKAETVDKTVEDLDELENNVKKAEDKIKSVADRVEGCKPNKLDVEELEVKAVELKDVEAELEEMKPLFDELNRRGRFLTEKGIGSEDLNGQLTAVKNDYNTLSARGPKRAKEIGELNERLSDFNVEYAEAEESITAIEKAFEAEQPVGSTVEEINSQMDELKGVQSSIEKSQEKIANLTDIQSAMKSSHPNVDASPVDENLNQLNNRLLQANQRVSDRKGKLEEGLVKCGQFKDALHSVVEWLEETQELVDGQRPINVLDPNVLKAQIMEQKLLIRMFNDRATSIKTLQATGEELLKAKDTSDEKSSEIEEDLGKATKLWDSLNSYVTFRMERMDSAIDVSTKFNSEYDEATKKLADLQKAIDSGEWKPEGEPRRIKDQMDRFQVMKSNLKEVEPLIEDAAKAASELGEMCIPEDRELIRKKLETLYNTFSTTADSRANVSRTLKETDELSSCYYGLHDELTEWLESFEATLKSKRKPDGEETEVKEWQKSVQGRKPQFDSLVEMGQKLQKVVKDDQAKSVEDLATKDTERYEALKTDVDQRARELFLAKEKVDKFDEDIESLGSWLASVSEKYRNIEPIGVEPERVKQQMAEHQSLSSDIASREPTYEAVVDTGNTLLMACNEDEEPVISDKLENLKYKHDEVKKKTGERQAQLVEALLLSQQFNDLFKETDSRLTRTEDYLKDIDESRSKGIEIQKEKLKGLQDGINHLKPLMASLKETGNDIIKLSGPGRGSSSIKEKLDDSERRWDDLNKDVDEKGIEIGEAAQKTEEVQAQLEDLLAQFQMYKENCKNPKPVAVKEDLIEEQIKGHEQSQFEVSELFDTVDKLDSAVEEIAKEDPDSQTSKAIAGKLKKLKSTVAFVKEANETRADALHDGMEACQKFWPGLEKLKETLMDVQHKMESQGEPHFDPEAVEELQRDHEALRDELDSNEEVINTLCQVSPILVANASQPDKLNVHKQLSEVTDQWDNLESVWSKRKAELGNVHDLSVQYRDGLGALQQWLSNAEEDIEQKKEIGTEVNVVKEQLNENREFYKELVARQIDITELNQKATALMDKVDHDDADQIQESVDKVKRRWAELQSKINERQSMLEKALYHLGHVGVVMDEILIWIRQTKSYLSEEKKTLKDKKIIEVEMEKLKVIGNDIKAHESPVEKCKESGLALSKSTSNKKEQEAVDSKVNEVVSGWEEIQLLYAQRKKDLDNAFDESRHFQEQTRELLSWLTKQSETLKKKKPTGGKPDTAKEQLVLHKVRLCHLVAYLSIFYRYFNGHCTQEIRQIIPAPPRSVRTTQKLHPPLTSFPSFTT